MKVSKRWVRAVIANLSIVGRTSGNCGSGWKSFTGPRTICESAQMHVLEVNQLSDLEELCASRIHVCCRTTDGSVHLTSIFRCDNRHYHPSDLWRICVGRNWVCDVLF